MKNTVIKAVLLTFTIIISNSAFSQPPHGENGSKSGPPPVPSNDQVEVMVQELSKELSLSSEQEDDVLEIFKAHFDEVREKTSGNARPERSEMEALRSEFEKDLQSVLTEEQFETFQAFSKKKKKQRK